MVSICPLISKSSCSSINPLVTVSRAPITIDITVPFMFHNFFSILLQGPSTYPSFLFLLFILCSQPGQQNTTIRQMFFFFTIRSGLLAEIRWRVCNSKFQKDLCFTFFSGLCIYHLFVQGFHISVSWWVFTHVYVTASLLRSPELFSACWPISEML